MEQKNIPTILVILGVTGDLAAKKIIPALYNLFTSGRLPKMFRVIGYGRRLWQDAELQEYVAQVMARHGRVDTDDLASFIYLFSYQSGLFETVEGYQQLAGRLGIQDETWAACSNKLFYLSVPPEKYGTILEHIKSTGLSVPCSDQTGWTTSLASDSGWARILIEKPFGSNARSAEVLDEKLGEMFQENQIYRIDHYLAKEALQNILSFRFANDIFEQLWSREHILSIHIRTFEVLGVESRGSFYDKVGALRDVGQNHLLQMLALLTMDRPKSFTAADIRAARLELLKEVIELSEKEIISQTFRAQYLGFQEIAGVGERSDTETYFKITLGLRCPKWQGVPITLEAGKRMGSVKKDIRVTFKHREPCSCPQGAHRQNRLVFSLEPEEKVSVSLWTKQLGNGFEVQENALEFSLRGADQREQYVEEYEKLLLDAVLGDQTSFVSTGEVGAMWQVVDPIISAWQKGVVPLRVYAPDTDEATLAAVGFG